MTIFRNEDISPPISDSILLPEKQLRTVEVPLEVDNFDEYTAEQILSLDPSTLVNSADFMLKSMYDFDLETDEGVNKLLSLLPILDSDIVRTVVQEIWPGYDVSSETYNPDLARLEVRGFLLDYLENYEGS